MSGSTGILGTVLRGCGRAGPRAEEATTSVAPAWVIASRIGAYSRFQKLLWGTTSRIRPVGRTSEAPAASLGATAGCSPIGDFTASDGPRPLPTRTAATSRAAVAPKGP